MNRWFRLLIAVAALVVFTAPLVPVAAGTTAGCACTMRCCCNPQGAGGGCRLSRPCGTGDEAAASSVVPTFRPAVIDAAVPNPVPPVPVARVSAASGPRTRSLSEPPPVPPPRPSSSC
ncbi:MAG TPA: hypothetical protein VFC25_15655 [Verrucomicrobiae bacterium]|nr:hypothetical protein [Verrucomicrobiae bacterium]